MTDSPDEDGPWGGLRSAAAAALAALLAFLPFARGVLRGEAFYFRDLAVYFFPLRRYVVEGLRELEVRFWNPYVYGGVPLALPPLSYPVELLQILVPDERGFTLLLALHLPLAAVGLYVLARSMGLGRVAAVGGAVVYSLGGFALSTVNLYVYLEAFAWGPFVIWGMIRAAQGGLRRAAVASALVAIALSTTAIELVAQTLLIGGLLALQGSRRSWAAGVRVGASVGLGLGMAAAPLIVVAGALAGSARGAGFPTAITLAHSVHPMTFLQIVVGGLYGDLNRIADRFWGQNFFPLGFPYLLSLYLGATTLALAAVGAFRASPSRLRLLVLLLLALVVCLGPWAGLEPLVDAVPLVRRIRYPSKAFFTAHTCIALLASLGLDALGRSLGGRSWRGLAVSLAGMGGVLLAAPWLPFLLPHAIRWFLIHFFPADASLAIRIQWLGLILEDAARGGLLVAAAASVAILGASRRLRPLLATGALVALVATDLLRTGAGLNPTVGRDFYTLSAETREWADRVRGKGRIFTCDVGQSPSYLRVRSLRPGGHETWSFTLLAESLTPLLNLETRLPSALSPDLTMLVPVDRVSSPDQASCRDLDGLLPRLREGGVSHVLSLDPLHSSDLTPAGSLAPERIAPAVIHLYALREPRPEIELENGSVARFQESPSEVRFETESLEATTARVNVTPHAGWMARVDDQPAPVTATSDGRIAVRLAQGHHQVGLRFRPPGLTAGLLLTGLSCLLAGLLAAWRGDRSRAGPVP